MKNLLMSVVMFFVALTFSFAYSNAEEDQRIMLSQDDLRVKVDIIDIPAAVKVSFDKSDFKDYSIVETYRLTDTEGTKFEFDVDMNGAKWAVFFDTEGAFLYKKVM